MEDVKDVERSEEQKYLMFFLNNENYGLPILQVNEIIGVMDITPIPKTPNFMKGIINLRGKIIPVMDLRLKFTMEEREYDQLTCIIIVETHVEGRKNFVGILVDKVAEVVNVYSKDIELPPQYGQEEDTTNFLTGIGKVKDKVVMLLNIDSIIHCQEMINLIKNNSLINKSEETSLMR